MKNEPDALPKNYCISSSLIVRRSLLALLSRLWASLLRQVTTRGCLECSASLGDRGKRAKEEEEEENVSHLLLPFPLLYVAPMRTELKWGAQ